jgi:hypothetical protein
MNKKPTSYGLGSTVFDTKDRKEITPGQWTVKDGPALKDSIKWWDFLATEAQVRGRVGKKYERRYETVDGVRRRIK